MSQQQNPGGDRSVAPSFSATPPVEDAIQILYVDDDESLAETTATWLERENDALVVTTATSAEAGVAHLDERSVDCIVSDYDVPGSDGLEFLRQVRGRYPDLPFILYTGQGSEEIASEAISAGVTDYLKRETSTEQYAILAKRIENTVSRYRAERAVEQTRERFQKLIQYSTDVISIVDADGTWKYLTPSAERVLGYEPEELIGDVGFDHVHPDDRSDATQKFRQSIEDPAQIPTFEFRFDHPTEGWIWLENHARNMVEDPVIDGFVVHSRDVTDRKRRQQELTRQNERLEEVVNTLAHDIRNPLDVADGRLRLAREADHEEHLERIERAHARMEQIIDDLVTLAREGERVERPQPVALETITAGAWQNVETHDATVDNRAGETILADRSRCQRLFENLFRNAIEHGGREVTVTVADLDDGFSVADDGPGIEPDEYGRVFESGYSTADGGTGFGLSIVQQIVVAHDWEIDVTDSQTGGTRFEITGVEFV